VEHACQQCGTSVEDGRPFCPQCRTPQIHVQVAVPQAEVSAEAETAEGGFPPEISEARLASLQSRQSVFRGAVDRRTAVRAALKAGGLGVFVGMIPFVGIPLTGALAVLFYRRASGFVVPPATGSRLGGAAGAVVFAINALFTIPIIIFHAQQECLDLLMTTARKFGVNTESPQFQASIHNLFTPSGLVINFLVIVVLASVGGALGSLFLRRGRTRD